MGRKQENITINKKIKAGIPDSINAETGEGIRILLYSHDTLGLGHIQRNLKIARGLKAAYADIEIKLVTGSTLSKSLIAPPNFNCVELPPVRKVGAEQYESQKPDQTIEQIISNRKEIIVDTLKDFNPHIFIVDHSPIGMKGELLPALNWIKENKPNIATILGLRDIIDDPSFIIPLWERKQVFEALRTFYTSIVIYGNPQFFDVTDEYKFPSDIIEKTNYAGYIIDIENRIDSNRQSANTKTERKSVLVTIGGGEWAGAAIVGNMLELLKNFKNEITFDCVIITGPFFPDKLWEKYSDLAKDLPVKMEKFVADLGTYLDRCDLVVSTAGYNTVTDVIGRGKKALFIPRIKFRNEQLLRAKRLEKLGIAGFLHPDDVTPKSLLNKITKIINNSEKQINMTTSRELFRQNGIQYMVDYLGKLFVKIQMTVKR